MCLRLCKEILTIEPMIYGKFEEVMNELRISCEFFYFIYPYQSHSGERFLLKKIAFLVG
jgi:hypothetical protein